MHSRLTSPRFVSVSPLLSLILIFFLGGLHVRSYAQMTLDGSLGPNGPLVGPSYIIPAEVGQQRGSNLFHSFGQFNIHLGESATFTGPDSVHNVMGRVTGGEQSIINGLLRSDIPGANLFLLNPQGVIFGHEAILDVAGSFHVSTADVLRFADGATFAVGSQSTLTVASPAAFGFERRPNPAPIAVNGSHLAVPEGETLAIIGGDVTIVGDVLSGFAAFPTLDAPSGRIHLVSAAARGEVRFDSAGLQMDTMARFGTITVSDFAFLSTSGEQSGTVVIRGGSLVVDSSDIFADTLGDTNGAEIGIDIAVTETFVHTHGGFITADSLGAGDAGNIRITADVLRMEDEALLASAAFAEGNAGKITVEATKVILTGGAHIESSTLEGGEGGTVTVRASDTVLLAGIGSETSFPSGIVVDSFSTEEGAGGAGDVLVEARTMSLIDGAQITSSTITGQGGTVTIRASEAVILVGTRPFDGFVALPSGILVNTFGSGDAGAIRLEAETVSLSGGAEINSSTAGSGQGGQVTVWASDAVTLTGTGPDGVPTSISADTAMVSDLEATGAGGTIHITARTVTVAEGARISSVTESPGRGGAVIVQASDAVILVGTSQGIPSSITSDTNDTTIEGLLEGDSGTVLVEVRTVRLSGGAQISSATEGPGQGGTVTITATKTVTIDGPDSGLVTAAAESGEGGNIRVDAQDIRLRDGAVMSAQSSGEGDAGVITLIAGDTLFSQGSTVTTEAIQADGGDIEVKTGKLVLLQDSQVTATVGEGEGGGGNIDMNAKLVALLNSRVRADAFGGPGGNITIVADALLADPTSSVTASSALNVDGEVEIRALIAELSSVVAPLSQDFLRATALIPQRCAARRSGKPASSFVLAGRDSTPAEPDGALPSPPVRVRRQALYQQRVDHGLSAYQRGDFEQAVLSWTETAEWAERDGNDLERSVVLTYLGQAYQALGRVTKALRSFETALTLARAAGNPLQMATVLSNLGNAYTITGPVHLAEQYLEQAHDLALALDDAALASRIENNHGNLWISQAQPQTALDAYLKSIEFAQGAGQSVMTALARTNAAVAALQAGRYEEAASRLDEALKQWLALSASPQHRLWPE